MQLVNAVGGNVVNMSNPGSATMQPQQQNSANNSNPQNANVNNANGSFGVPQINLGVS